MVSNCRQYFIVIRIRVIPEKSLSLISGLYQTAVLANPDWTGLQAAVLANQNSKQKAGEIESAGKHATLCKRGKICNR